MEFGENPKFDGRSFRFPEEFLEEDAQNGKSVEVVEADQEIKLEEVEIRETDIKGVEAQMERERSREGLDGGQRLAFVGAALERLRKEAPEAGIGKVELSEGDIKKCKERMEKDITEAVEAKTKKGKKENWDQERINEEIKSEQIWIREFQTSYLKEILDEKTFKENNLEVSKEEWDEMVADLKNLIAKEDWHKVIPRMGHMNNIDPEKFDNVRSLFNTTDRDRMLQHIEELKGDELTGENANSWELASRIRYVAECFPELRSRIKLSDKNWERMTKLIQEARDVKWEGEEKQKKYGVQCDYWKVAYQECNMKIIENMADRGEIKVVEEKIEEEKSAVE